MLEAMLEITLCVVIGLDFRDSFPDGEETMTTVDRVSDALTYILLCLLIIFTLVVIEFSLIRSRRLHTKSAKRNRKRYQQYIRDSVTAKKIIMESTRVSDENLSDLRSSLKLTLVVR